MKKTQAGQSASMMEEKLQEQHGAAKTEPQKKANVTSENFFYPQSKVLKNKYNIKEQKVLNEQCAHDVAQEMIKLYQEPLPEKIDSSYLKHIHQRLFRHTFEWAGHTRDTSFTFKDGTVASQSEIKRKEFKTPFASSKKVREGLKNLDQVLSETNYLKGLTRKEFVEYTTGLMINLHHMHPFREGNRRTQRMFFEKLAQSAGHNLDFSLVPRKRKLFVNVEAIDHGNPEPMKHLLEDISNPEKVLVLKEFTNAMRELGLDERNYRFAVAAKDGQTYDGIYRGAGDNGFMIDVKGTFIVGNKKHLSPEQIKTLKIGDRISFTAPMAEDLQQTLIPGEKVPSLTREEIAERVQNSPLVQRCRKDIETLCKIVYGNPHILQQKLSEIDIPITLEDISKGERFARQIEESPQSIRRLRGIGIGSLKSGARLHAEVNVLPLSHAIFDYVHFIRLEEKDILEKHHAEQRRCEKSIEIPGEWMQNLCSLPKEQQQEILSQSPELRAEINTYMRQLQERLSLNERRALRLNNYEELAKSIGTSVNHAKKITEIAKKGQELQQNMQSLSSHRLEAYSAPSLKAIKAEKVTVTVEKTTGIIQKTRQADKSVAITEDLQRALIPGEKIAPLTREEIAERIQNSSLVQKCRKKIETLCEVVYGDPYILQQKLSEIKIPITSDGVSEGEKFARQVEEFPQSIHKLRGIGIGSLKSGARSHAEINVLPLSHAICDYVHSIRTEEKDILENHHIEQKRCEKSVEMPGEWMQNLCSLPPEQQQRILSQSPELRAEINTYMTKLQERLSLSERKALREGNEQELAKSIGIPVNNAREIIEIFKQGKALQQNMQFVSSQRLEAYSTLSTHQLKENKGEKYTKSASPKAIKAEKVTVTIEPEKAKQQDILPRKVEHAKVVALTH
ncbi:BID domain-containing T4SS effector [Bartonella alsatica]|uniref:protein adenylyltransferase n=2 Tax=Bartonella alsatica TaxID=52764 RepID=J1IY65_9HYPH|nr:BID domain-containing T4SS effector [Bartonella alsatica]EJF76215.1 hypothetical protein MEC_00018 [Bartonella alsatica IBS 382]QLC51826.1 BID domain-containing T4SS effector [Bartonella alsatica]